MTEDFRSSSSSSYQTALNTPCYSDYYSAIGSEDEDEFYDVPTDGDETPKASELNGHSLSAERLSMRIKELQDEESKHLRFFLEIDQFMETSTEGQKLALDKLRSNQDSYSDNVEFLWRFCKAVYLVAVVMGQEGDMSKKQEMIFEAVDVGSKAIACDDNSSEAHKWYAIAVGIRGEYLGIKEKILDGFEFKKHIDKASELAPNDHTIRHLLGR